MMNNNTNKAFLLITTCMFLCLGAIIAQPTCKQYDDWCTHEVRVENSSSNEVSVWCKEIGCDNTDYFMANLKPGEHLFAYPDAYNAVFSIKFGNITLKTFDQLGADWNCNYYTFNYSNDSFVDCSKGIDLRVSPTQSICEGGSVEICADNASHYVWSNGATSKCIIVSPLYTQAYSVTGSKNGCEQTGYVNVNVFSSVNLKVSSEQSICEGGSVEICADNASHYVWSNGATSKCIIVSPHYTQAYSVTGSKNGCEQTGTVNVNVIECQSNFNTCIPNDFNLYESYISAHEADLEWVEVPGATYTFYIKESHESVWGIFDIHENYVTVQSLNYCAHYQWAVLITCSDGKTAEFSPTREFSTCGHQPRISSTKNATVSFNSIENAPILEIAPNPATDFLKINYTGLNLQQLKVYNTSGQLTETLQADESGISTLNTSNYNKGMYVIFAEANDKVFKNKFIVR